MNEISQNVASYIFKNKMILTNSFSCNHMYKFEKSMNEETKNYFREYFRVYLSIEGMFFEQLLLLKEL